MWNWYVCRYAVTITICGAQWGWTVIGILVLGGGAYVGGGILLGGRAGRGSGKAAHMSAHPHFEQWMEVRGLFNDGVRFCQGGGRGQVAAGGGYARVNDSGDGANGKGNKSHGKRGRG